MTEPWYNPHIVGEQRFKRMVWQDVAGAPMTVELARRAYDAGTH
jgi:hypothetical protein